MPIGTRERDLAPGDLADEGIPITVTCRVLGFSKRGYFKRQAKPICDRDPSDAYLINAALEAHLDDPGFGYRFISDELEAPGLCGLREPGAAAVLLAAHLVVPLQDAGAQPQPGPPVHDDLVQRDFTATKINELWLTDISEHPTGEGKPYLCAVKDVFSNGIVG